MLAKLKNVYISKGFYFPILIAFLLPFGYEFNCLIILWGIAFFLYEDISAGFKKILRNKWSYVLFIHFFLNVAACFFSSNKRQAIYIAANAICWLVFPVMFFSDKLTPLIFKQILLAFITGCFLTGLFCILRAFIVWIIFKEDEFYYSKFAFFTHPSYMAMYFIFAQIIVMLYYKQWFGFSKKTSIQVGILSVLFIVCIVLFASKMGIISAALLLTMTVLRNNNSIKYGLVIVAGLFLVLLIGLKIFSFPLERFNTLVHVTLDMEHIDKTSHESTAVRILIWKASEEIIFRHFVLGSTPGDANDELFEAYRINGLTGALTHKLSAHNQFLQTFIGMGIIGFFLLLIITLFLTIFAFIKRHFLMLLFGLLIMLNFLVESMLLRPCGTIFFIFFLCLLLVYNPGKKEFADEF